MKRNASTTTVVGLTVGVIALLSAGAIAASSGLVAADPVSHPQMAEGTTTSLATLKTVHGTFRLNEHRSSSGELRIQVVRPDGARTGGGACDVGQAGLRLCGAGTDGVGAPVLLTGSASGAVDRVAAIDARAVPTFGVVASGRFLILTEASFQPTEVIGLDASGQVVARSDGEGVIGATLDLLPTERES